MASLSVDSAQGSGQLVVFGTKDIEDMQDTQNMCKKEIYIVTFDFTDNILDDDVISIYLDRIIGGFSKNCEYGSMWFRWKNSECNEEEKILTILILSLIHGGDKTFDLAFIINCNHFRKTIKITTNSDLKKSHDTTRLKKLKRKHAMAKKKLSIQVSGESDVEIVLVECGTQVVNDYFDEPK